MSCKLPSHSYDVYGSFRCHNDVQTSVAAVASIRWFWVVQILTCASVHMTRLRMLCSPVCNACMFVRMRNTKHVKLQATYKVIEQIELFEKADSIVVCFF